MNTLRHKGYAARVDYDDRDNIFVGRVLGISSITSFHGESVTELHAEFEKAVDDFLADCAERGTAPEKPAFEKLMLRIRPEVHAAVSIAAQASGKSINQWADEVLARATHS
jgi:predicted HicB family RNase H-like nuclease